MLEMKPVLFMKKGSPNNARLLTYFGAFDAAIILIALALPLLAVGVGYYISQAFFRSIQ